jgi:hypothetical protein
MQGRSAFTAKYWGDTAVVCRATEGRTGPVVEQQFGQFKTWTPANYFASRLNGGLEIHHSQAAQIITSSTLEAGDVLRMGDSLARIRDARSVLVEGKSLRVQFMLAELDLALTFCRILRSKRSQHGERMLRNSRNALFYAIHFVCESQLPVSDLETINERLTKLQGALEEPIPQYSNR